jgi:hypothetical protein
MAEFPFGYERIAATTWAYMSSLLMLALFFKFNRFWSVRNFDLLLIILLAPGLLMIEAGGVWLAREHQQKLALIQSAEIAAADQTDESDNTAKLESQNSESDVEVAQPDTPAPPAATSQSPPVVRIDSPGHTMQRWGYYWMFCIGAICLLRMLLDPSLFRKPLLNPNLTIGGLVFLGLSLMVFLFANVIAADPTTDDLDGARDAVKLLQRKAADAGDEAELTRRGPGYRLFNLLPIIPSFNNGGEIMRTNADEAANMSRYVIAAKSLAIASQVLIVLGLIFFSYLHYQNFNVGVGIAIIYLMLPYTAIYTGHVLHVLPAALMIWALVCFRRPWLAGILFGLAIGVSYYAIFLLPLWISFYWSRGLRRFLTGVFLSLGICILGLAFTSASFADFFQQLQTMFGFWWPLKVGLEGIWALGWDQWYRMPIVIAFITLCVSFVFWPVEKDLGTLVSYSAAIMLGVQFWHGFGGGLYVAWYLPMMLLVFFRPNLKGRVAVTELNESNWRKRPETAADLIPAA